MKKVRKTEVLGVLLAVGLAGGGCGGGSGGSLGEMPTIAGKIDDWKLGTGYSVLMKLSQSKMPSAVVAAGFVDDTGAFDMVLPSSEALAPQLREPEPLFSPSCKKTPTMNPPLFRMVSAVFIAKSMGRLELRLTLGTGLPATPGSVEVAYTYADRPVSLVGELDCGEGSSTIHGEMNMQLVKGWNLVVTTLKEYGSSPSGFRIVSEAHTGPIPADAKWSLPEVDIVF